MDPLAMAGTALSILKKIKEQVKECEAAFFEARELRMQIEGFEVTIMMTPSKGKTEETEKKKEDEPAAILSDTPVDLMMANAM